MKITVTTIESFDYNTDAEYKRLRDCFEGDVLKRQLDILDAFLNGDDDFSKVRELFNNLPHNEESGCSEREFVGDWITFFTGGGWGVRPKSVEKTIALKK